MSDIPKDMIDVKPPELAHQRSSNKSTQKTSTPRTSGSVLLGAC